MERTATRKPRRKLAWRVVLLGLLGLLSYFFLSTERLPPLPRRYTIEVIEPPAEYIGAEAEAINNLGETVGRFRRDTTLFGGEAFARFPTGVIEMLGEVVVANDINDSGQVAGIMETEASDFTPITIDIRARPPAFVHLPGELEQGALCGNNDAGFSVGWFEGPAVWSATGEITSIHLDNRADGFASDINNKNVVVGFSRPDASVAFVWDATRGVRLVPGVHSNVMSVAYAVNDHGDVVGYDRFDVDRKCAFLWREGSHAIDLGALLRFDSEAYDVNELRQVVGFFDSTSLLQHAYQRLGERYATLFKHEWVQRLGLSPPTHLNRRHTAFLWEEGTMYDLNAALPGDSGWSHLIKANGINNRGQIVGTGTYKGRQCGYVLTPVDDGLATE